MEVVILGGVRKTGMRFGKRLEIGIFGEMVERERRSLYIKGAW